MARMPRVVVPEYPHHITQRGNRRQRTFFADSDYQYYTELIVKYAHEAKTEIWAYCLMPNHVHLILVPNTEDGLRATLGEAHRHYTRSINFRKGWRGHLWQERFHSFVMDEYYLQACVRYVERNPVEAGLCRSPEDWKWSSARARLESKEDPVVDVRPMRSRVKDWRSYWSVENNEAQSKQIDHHSQTGRPLGDRVFVGEIEQLTGRSFALGKPGRKAKGGA